MRRRAGFRRQHRGDRVDRATEADAHAILGLHSLGEESMRDPAAPFCESSERRRARALSDRDRVRGGGDARTEQGVERRRSGPRTVS